MKKFLFFFTVVVVIASCTPKPDNGGDFAVEIGVNTENITTGQAVNFFLKNVVIKDMQSAVWSFGDGATANTFVATHTFDVADEYVVTVQVTNKAGRTASATKTLTVVDIDRFSLNDALDNFDTSAVWIMAHRCNADDGTNSYSIPENSMPALYNCIDLFAKGVLNIVEIDPRYTSDGVMIIMHDETVNRTTNGTGKVSEMAYEQIRQLRLKLPNGTVTDDTVPTVREFFKAAKGKIFIDLDYYEKVPTSDLYYLAKECDVLDQVMFSTGNHSDALNFLESVDPKGIIFSNVGSAENITAHKQRGIKITHITNSKVLTTALVGTAVQSGLITSSELLNQNGITIDSEIRNNNYSGLDAFVATGLNCVQTDLAPKVHTYLKNKGKRK